MLYDRTKLRMGTEAHHQLGDISRSNPDYFWLDREDELNFYGAWLTGLGFVEVRFPKATSRELTDAEFDWLEKHPAVIA